MIAASSSYGVILELLKIYMIINFKIYKIN
jgi:hypothetical protein